MSHRAPAPRPLRPAVSLVVPAFVFLLAGCGAAPPSPEEESAPPPPVEALPAREGTLPLSERLNGVVRADNQVVVRPEVSGRVVEVLVRSGAAVERGQPLVRLEPQGLREQLRQAEADVRLAAASAAGAKARVTELEAEVSRSRALAADGLVSALEAETLEARLDAAQAAASQAAARVEQAEAAADESRYDLERAVVRAPTAGRVGRREVEVGTIAGPGTALFVLGDLDDLVVEIPLTESMLSFIEEGQTVRVAPRAGSGKDSGGRVSSGAGAAFEAALSRISPFLDPGSFTTTGEIDVADSGEASGLRPGMFVTVEVLYGESERATLVPASALWEDPRSGIRGIYVFARPPAEAPEEAGDESGAALDEAAVADPTAEGSPPEDPSEEAFPVDFRPVVVVAEGRAVVGVRGVEPGEWVVVVGQHLLAKAEEPRARVRVASWSRVMALQGLQREDLLASFLDKQQRLARERGARPPSNEEFLRAAPAAGEGRP